MAVKKTTKTKASADKAKKAPKAQAGKTEKSQAPKPAKAGDKPTKLSAIDAAVKVLGATGQAMNCKEMIEAMTAKGHWKIDALRVACGVWPPGGARETLVRAERRGKTRFTQSAPKSAARCCESNAFRASA